MAPTEPRRSTPLVLGVVLVGLLVAGLVLAGTGALGRLGERVGAVVGAGPECTVQTADGEVGLEREEAQRAVTAVALSAREQLTPDTSDLAPAVLERLAAGPPEGAGPSLRCRGTGPGDLAQEELTDSGLTPRAERVRQAMAEVFGEQSLGGFEPGGVQRPEESTHNTGRAIDVFYRPISEEHQRQGWILAQWLVAHAEDLDIQYVIFDDRYWSARENRGRWSDYDAPPPADDVLRHLDHVHVDVFRGDPA